jgi:hypothetical protein
MSVNVVPTHWDHIAIVATPHVPKDFTGSITLHVGQGSVNRIEIRQTFAPTKEDTR